MCLPFRKGVNWNEGMRDGKKQILIPIAEN